MSRNDPYRAGPAGEPGRVPEHGTARVETRVTGGQGREEPAMGDTDAGSRTEELAGRAAERAQQAAEGARNRVSEWGEEARERMHDLGDQARGRAHEWSDEARERVDELADQASGWTSRARHELGDVFHRAEDRLEEQTGAVSMIRQNPLLAAGLAFGAGFLMAGGGDGGGRKQPRRGLTGRAAGSIRSALVSGASAMLMQELQDLMDEHGGPAGLLNAITGRGGSRDEELEEYR